MFEHFKIRKQMKPHDDSYLNINELSNRLLSVSQISQIV